MGMLLPMLSPALHVSSPRPALCAKADTRISRSPASIYSCSCGFSCRNVSIAALLPPPAPFSASSPAPAGAGGSGRKRGGIGDRAGARDRDRDLQPLVRLKRGLRSESSLSGAAFWWPPPQHHRRCATDYRKAGIHVSMSTMSGSVDGVVKTQESDALPDHLLVLVHGILASAKDWRYVQGELKGKLGTSYLIHASSVNSYLQTLTGIDTSGKRLADEIRQVVTKNPSLKKISFVAHSLGGLFTRYAIAVLYEPAALPDGNGKNERDGPLGTIAGLQPIILITLATPHLGVRGKNQLPILLGVPVLEKLAPPLAPLLVGRTGRQLFLTDGKAKDPPLLLRMASDCEEGKFISALRAFKLRVLYANVSYDHLVGWRTSSIRREAEVKPPKQSLKGYKHVVRVVDCAPVKSSSPSFGEDSAKAKEAAQTTPTSQIEASYHDKLEEEMIKGLQRVAWRKVDVSFHATLWPFLAHNNIHVKHEWMHYEGAGVVAHVADTLKDTVREQDTGVQIKAML